LSRCEERGGKKWKGKEGGGRERGALARRFFRYAFPSGGEKKKKEGKERGNKKKSFLRAIVQSAKDYGEEGERGRGGRKDTR